jgi:hypothetical protein
MLRLMTVGRMLGLAVLGALCGCSLLLDTSEFRAGDRALRIDGIEPIQVTEGAMEPVIVRGQGLTEGVIVSAFVVLPGGDQPVPIAGRLESPDGTELGLLLDVPVLPELGPEDDPVSVRIDLERGDTLAADQLELRALSELVLDANMPLDTTEMAERYSEINVTGPAMIRGPQPARLVATRAIRINAVLDANGESASGDQPGPGGPGGCAGGAGGASNTDGQPGGCDLGGGRAGITATGDSGPGGSGGGGGCGDDALNGEGANSGVGGENVCSLELVPLGEPSNRGHGGGGGGSFESAIGGGGGGGGGVVELDAPLVVLNAAVTASGGNGAAGQSLQCDQPRFGGGGGGGSGGVVVVRADTLVVTERDRISARGGLGAQTCAGGPGGSSGAAGRVRIDVATLQSSTVGNIEQIADLFSRDNLWQGPRLATSTPRLTLSGQVAIRVRGDDQVTYALRVDREQPVTIGGEQTLELALERGLRVVCVLVQGVDPELSESQHCLTIAVLDR